MKKARGIWHLTVNYCKLNAAVVSLIPAIPDSMMAESIVQTEGFSRAVLNMADAFFSIPLDLDGRSQFAFMWVRLKHIYCAAKRWSRLSHDFSHWIGWDLEKTETSPEVF